MLQNRFFSALASRSGFGATISDAVARSSIVFCNSVSADCIVMAASRLLRAVVAFVVSHEMRFWEIADARNPMFFHTKSVPEPRWSTSAVRRVRDGLVCGRIMVGSWSDHGRIGLGSFPQCKWDCKWCWWMSCQWNSSVICNCSILPAM